MFVEPRSAWSNSTLLKSLAGATLCSALFLCAPCQAQESRLENNELAAANAPDTDHIVLRMAQQQVVSAEGVRSYSEGVRGIVDVRLTKAGDQFVLVGQRQGSTTLLLIMEDGSQKHLVIDVTDADGNFARQGRQTVTQEDNIRLDFYFVQLNRSDNLQVGLGYPQSISMGSFEAGFDFLTQRFESATAVIQDQALLRLDMAQSGGWAKIMSKAALITENWQQTTFAGGGEVNIPVTTSMATGIHSIEYGSVIDVLPRYDSESGRIQISLKADVSDLTEDRGSGAPGRLTSSLNTVVNLELGQAVVLAGLSSESRMESHGGVPVLSQIPILGWLFGSDRRAYQSFDNVIFIVPTVVDATSRDARARIQKAVEVYQSYHGQKKLRKEFNKDWQENEPTKSR
jgi:pilus assembly protein CpaC